jgi:hypothetical protein
MKKWELLQYILEAEADNLEEEEWFVLIVARKIWELNTQKWMGFNMLEKNAWLAVTNHFLWRWCDLTPRPRSRDKVVPVSIGIPVSLMIRLDNKLDWKQSRSKWVKSAIIQKLDDSFDYDSIPTRSLLNLLFTRKIIDYDLITLLRMRVEEIEELQ